MERIGFIGVGSIGAPMARSLVRAGYKVTVCDKAPQALERFEGHAFRITESPRECSDNEMIIVMVATDSQVKDVVLETDGFLDAVDPRRPPLLAVMSSVLPQTVQDLAPHCAKKDVRLVDAPVSGMPIAAEQGKLTIMVGGEEADLDEMRPVFRAMGENIYHTGPLGSGAITKLVNQIIAVTNLFLSVEAMLLGKKLGMDLHKLAAILDNSSGRNLSTKDWEKGRAIFEFFSQTLDLSKVMVDLSRKDLENAQKLAKTVKLECPLLDHIVRAVNAFSYQEIQHRWHSVT